MADIGGNHGTAAVELQEIEGVKAFVIDPFEMGPIKSSPRRAKGLPKNRLFVSKIEETKLPDESFHFMTSYNSYQYMSFPKSFIEPYRLLKKGGGALLQISQFYDLKFLEQMNSLEFKDNIHVAFRLGPRKSEIVPFSAFLEGPRAIHKEYGDKAEGILELTMNPAFIITKK